MKQRATMRLRDKVALVTGGNRGIGLATAKLFATEGARVVLVARDEDRGKAAERQIDGAMFFRGDVRKAEDCERAVDQTVGSHGQLDVLVNNAGVIYRNRPVERTSLDEWRTTFDTNVTGTFLMCKYALPALRSTRGAIVNVASYVGLVGFAATAAYAASKAAVVNLTRSMALDHAREGVRVNCVCPGSVDTEMIQSAWRAFGDYEEAKRLWTGKHPMGRIATPEEIAEAILFLASEHAGFVTGAALPVDGGITAG